MAKESMKAREAKRLKLVERYAAKRAALKAEGETVCVDCKRACIPEGIYRDLWSGKMYQSENGFISWHSDGCDALLLVNE